MITITEDYVSFEIAKLLKEKGFDGTCSMIYTIEGELLFAGLLHHNLNITSNTHSKYFSDIIATSPTLQMAMKWLLKKYNIFICPLFLEESNGFGYTIENIIKKKYITTSKNSSYKEPEEACETAIKYCLENLI